MKTADVRFLMSGAVMFCVMAACGPDSNGSPQDASNASMNAAPPVEVRKADAKLDNRPTHFNQPRIIVSDDCLNFLMNKHQRANACENPTTGQ